MPETNKIDILIVEDNLVSAMVYEQGLMHEDFTIHKAANYKEAFDVLADEKIKLDLIVLDNGFPGIEKRVGSSNYKNGSAGEQVHRMVREGMLKTDLLVDGHESEVDDVPYPHNADIPILWNTANFNAEHADIPEEKQYKPNVIAAVDKEHEADGHTLTVLKGNVSLKLLKIVRDELASEQGLSTFKDIDGLEAFLPELYKKLDEKPPLGNANDASHEEVKNPDLPKR